MCSMHCIDLKQVSTAAGKFAASTVTAGNGHHCRTESARQPSFFRVHYRFAKNDMDVLQVSQSFLCSRSDHNW